MIHIEYGQLENDFMPPHWRARFDTWEEWDQAIETLNRFLHSERIGDDGG